MADIYDSLPKDQAVRPRSGGSHPEEFGTFISVGWGGIPGLGDPVTLGDLKDWPIGRFVEWAQGHEDQISTMGTPWEEFVRQEQSGSRTPSSRNRRTWLLAKGSVVKTSVHSRRRRRRWKQGRSAGNKHSIVKHARQGIGGYQCRRVTMAPRQSREPRGQHKTPDLAENLGNQFVFR